MPLAGFLGGPRTWRRCRGDRSRAIGAQLPLPGRGTHSRRQPAVLGCAGFADHRPRRRRREFLSVSRDITALKEAENRQQLLALELSHRIKNVLALVQSIANQTLKGGAEISAAKRGFDGRLQSLSSAQDLLTQSSWTKADLGMLVEGALAPHAEPSRFSITGADTELSSKCALALALALHELATNAAKYGALSTAEGRIAISWTLGPQFHLVWQGPAVLWSACRHIRGSAAA